jgi:hypothetical protein
MGILKLKFIDSNLDNLGTNWRSKRISINFWKHHIYNALWHFHQLFLTIKPNNCKQWLTPF